MATLMALRFVAAKWDTVLADSGMVKPFQQGKYLRNDTKLY